MSDGKCIIVCRTCSTTADMVALIPFSDYAARGKWAAAHTKGTGHDSWLCLDGWPSHDAVREYLFPPHAYLSTSCFHGEHGYCQSIDGYDVDGDPFRKIPGQCKFCDAPCNCSCHREGVAP